MHTRLQTLISKRSTHQVNMQAKSIGERIFGVKTGDTCLKTTESMLGILLRPDTFREARIAIEANTFELFIRDTLKDVSNIRDEGIRSISYACMMYTNWDVIADVLQVKIESLKNEHLRTIGE